MPLGIMMCQHKESHISHGMTDSHLMTNFRSSAINLQILILFLFF